MNATLKLYLDTAWNTGVVFPEDPGMHLTGRRHTVKYLSDSEYFSTHPVEDRTRVFRDCRYAGISKLSWWDNGSPVLASVSGFRIRPHVRKALSGIDMPSIGNSSFVMQETKKIPDLLSAVAGVSRGNRRNWSLVEMDGLRNIMADLYSEVSNWRAVNANAVQFLTIKAGSTREV